jgi:parallel beta-helix repeat protein
VKAALFAIAIAAVGLSQGSARAEVQDCLEIVSLPAVLTSQGVHCFKKDLAISATSGVAITINTNNVIIDMNGFKLGGLGAGPGTAAIGIYALDRQNITIRNGTIRGFSRNVFLDATSKNSSTGHLVELIRSERATLAGIMAEGRNIVVRDNLVYDTGNSEVTTGVNGIIVKLGGQNSVTRNIVGNVAQLTSARGITVEDSPNSVVSGNEIRQIFANSAIGILVVDSSSIVVKDNVLATGVGGDQGISATNSPNSACLDNVIVGFPTSVDGCALADGNRGVP